MAAVGVLLLFKMGFGIFCDLKNGYLLRRKLWQEAVKNRTLVSWSRASRMRRLHRLLGQSSFSEIGTGWAKKIKQQHIFPTQPILNNSLASFLPKWKTDLPRPIYQQNAVKRYAKLPTILQKIARLDFFVNIGENELLFETHITPDFAEQEIIESLITQSQHEDKKTKIKAITVLGELEYRNPKIVTALVKALQNKDENINNAAARALQRCRQDDLVISSALLKELNNTKWYVRKHAVRILGQRNSWNENSEIATKLLPITEDSDNRVRKEAIWSLRVIQNKIAIPSLVKALSDQSADVRAEAAKSLGFFEKKAIVSKTQRSGRR